MKILCSLILIVLFCLTSITSINAATKIPPTEELNFAMNYFKILYEYDIQAATFAKQAQIINSPEELPNFFKVQANFVNDISNKLSAIKPTEIYTGSYYRIINGLKEQAQYLINISEEVSSGYTFDKAFAIHNWEFFNAQKQIQSGIEEFKNILNMYSSVNQIKILSATGVTEEQLRSDAEDCEYIKAIQESLK